MRKRRVVVRIYGMKYSWKGQKDRNRHKNRIQESGQALLVYSEEGQKLAFCILYSLPPLQKTKQKQTQNRIKIKKCNHSSITQIQWTGMCARAHRAVLGWRRAVRLTARRRAPLTQLAPSHGHCAISWRVQACFQLAASCWLGASTHCCARFIKLLVGIIDSTVIDHPGFTTANVRWETFTLKLKFKSVTFYSSHMGQNPKGKTQVKECAECLQFSKKKSE